ncbi:hypothetical protein QYM36_018560, partial [Artemia franciscana]
STDEMNLRHASGQPASGKAPRKLPCTAFTFINGMKCISTLHIPTMMKWAKIASSATTYKGIPIGVGIFGAGVSMLIYHYDSIPQLRQVVEELKRLEADQGTLSKLWSGIWQVVCTVTGTVLVFEVTSGPRQ